MSDALANATARWHAATGLPIAAAAGDPWVELTHCSRPVWGCYTERTRSIVVTPHAPQWAWETVLAHEIGHALARPNKKHLPASAQGVMRPTISAARTCISAADLDLVCSAQPCLWEVPEC